MSDKNRIAGDAALACTFMVMHQIRHAFPDAELQAVFEEIRETVNGVIMAVLSAKEENAQ